MPMHLVADQGEGPALEGMPEEHTGKGSWGVAEAGAPDQQPMRRRAHCCQDTLAGHALEATQPAWEQAPPPPVPPLGALTAGGQAPPPGRQHT